MVVEKEPTFNLSIRACHFNHLTLEHLTEKLLLIKKLNLKEFYTITEDTVEETKILPPVIPIDVNPMRKNLTE